MPLTKLLSKGLAIIINVICFCFVISKSIECFVKYSKSPKGTNIGVEYTGHQKIFPTVSICGVSPKVDNDSIRWNLTHLHKCGMDEYEICSVFFSGKKMNNSITISQPVIMITGRMGNGFLKIVQIPSYFLKMS